MINEVHPYSAKSSEEYIRTRVDYKTEVYRKKGKKYRYWYLATATTSAVAAALVPVLINIGQLTLYPTLLSLLVSVLVSAEGIFHWREHWKSYDLIKSYLRQEACLYQAKAGPYFALSDSDAFRMLVERVEDAIAKERAQTIEMRTSVNRIGDQSQIHSGPSQPVSGARQGSDDVPTS